MRCLICHDYIKQGYHQHHKGCGGRWKRTEDNWVDMNENRIWEKEDYCRQEVYECDKCGLRQVKYSKVMVDSVSECEVKELK